MSLGVTFLELISLRTPFLGYETEEIYENILKRNNKEKNGFNNYITKRYSKNLLDLVKEMISMNPDDRPNAKDILNRDIIKERMESYLKENNFNENEAINNIDVIKKEIKEKESFLKNNLSITQAERIKNIKIIRKLKSKKEFLKKMIIIDNYSKNNFQTIE